MGDMAIQKLEQEKTNRDHSIRTLNDEIANQDEVINKLNKEKKHLSENASKSLEDLQLLKTRLTIWLKSRLSLMLLWMSCKAALLVKRGLAQTLRKPGGELKVTSR